jgi:hypothetical protein
MKKKFLNITDPVRPSFQLGGIEELGRKKADQC